MSRRIIQHLSRADPVMGRLIAAAGPYRMRPDLQCAPFQALARAITHQQLNGTAAQAILQRFVAHCGDGMFPTPEAVMAADGQQLRTLGLSFAKITSLKDLAAKTLAGVVPDRNGLEGLDDDEIVARVTEVRGIGRWSVEMMLIFQLGRPDVLPVDDYGVRNGFRLAYGLRTLPKPRALALFGERWRPCRTAAAWYLWRAVDLARAGTLPAPGVRTRMPRITRTRRPRVKRGSTAAKPGRPRRRTGKPLPAPA